MCALVTEPILSMEGMSKEHPELESYLDLINDTSPVPTDLFDTEAPASPLPRHDSFVVNTHARPTEVDGSSTFGTTRLDRWRMNDGTEYEVMIGWPNQPHVDIVVAFTTAWGTQVKGRNELVLHQLMRLGYPVALIGPEIGTSLPLSQSAHNFQSILNELDKRGSYQDKRAIVVGESRGAMIGFGAAAYAPQHERQNVYHDLTDPCIEHQLSPKELAEAAVKFPLEVACAVRQIRRLIGSGVDLRRYAKTTDFSIDGLLQFIRTGKALFSGEAGELAKQMPSDTQMHVRLFMNSVANHRKAYRTTLKSKPGVMLEEPKGAHLSLLRADTWNGVELRLTALREQLADGTKPEDIDFSQIHLGSVAVAA